MTKSLTLIALTILSLTAVATVGHAQVGQTLNQRSAQTTPPAGADSATDGASLNRRSRPTSQRPPNVGQILNLPGRPLNGPFNPQPGPSPYNPQPGPGPYNPQPGPSPYNPQPSPYNPQPGPSPFQPQPSPYNPQPSPYQPQPQPYIPGPSPYVPGPSPLPQPAPSPIVPGPTLQPTLGFVGRMHYGRGLEVLQINFGSVAQRMGLGTGNVITHVNGTQIRSHQHYLQLLQRAAQFQSGRIVLQLEQTQPWAPAPQRIGQLASGTSAPVVGNPAPGRPRP